MKKLVSFILPIYNEQENIPKLWEELQNLVSKMPKYEVEYIFINDGSKDNSLRELVNLHKADPTRVSIIDFARNFGHQIAVTAGQDSAKGDAVIIMDTDMQDPPLTCIDLLSKWEEGYQVVYAQRQKYKTNWLKETCAFTFYRLLKSIASVDIPLDTGDFRLLDKRVNAEMCKFKEKNRYLRGISSLIGFKQTAVLFNRSERYAGKTGYSFAKSLKLALDGLTAFSTVPLQFITITGFALSSLSISGGLIYTIISLFAKDVANGWASLFIAISFLSGVQLMMLGIMAEYVGRIYTQVLERPLYTVAEELVRKSEK